MGVEITALPTDITITGTELITVVDVSDSGLGKTFTVDAFETYLQTSLDFGTTLVEGTGIDITSNTISVDPSEFINGSIPNLKVAGLGSLALLDGLTTTQINSIQAGVTPADVGIRTDTENDTRYIEDNTDTQLVGRNLSIKGVDIAIPAEAGEAIAFIPADHNITEFADVPDGNTTVTSIEKTSIGTALQPTDLLPTGTGTISTINGRNLPSGTGDGGTVDKPTIDAAIGVPAADETQYYNGNGAFTVIMARSPDGRLWQLCVTDAGTTEWKLAISPFALLDVNGDPFLDVNGNVLTAVIT